MFINVSCCILLTPRPQHEFDALHCLPEDKSDHALSGQQPTKAVLTNGGFKVGENWIYYQDLPSWYFSQMWGYMTHQNHFGYFQASLNFTSVGSENLLIIKHQREFWSQKNHGRIKVCCSSWNSDLGWLIPNSDVLQSLGRHTYSAWVGGCDWFAVILLKKHRTVWNSHNTYIWEIIYIYI